MLRFELLEIAIGPELMMGNRSIEAFLCRIRNRQKPGSLTSGNDAQLMVLPETKSKLNSNQLLKRLMLTGVFRLPNPVKRLSEQTHLKTMCPNVYYQLSLVPFLHICVGEEKKGILPGPVTLSLNQHATPSQSVFVCDSIPAARPRRLGLGKRTRSIRRPLFLLSNQADS